MDELDVLLKEHNKFRSLYHYYKNMNPRNELDTARMNVAKNNADEYKKKIKEVRYQLKVKKFLEEHPEMKDNFSSE